jgi:molybdate transport system substrate-binding protein
MTACSLRLTARFVTCAGLLLGVLLGSLACTSYENGSTELRVFAAASLTESFTALAAAFEAEHDGLRVRVHTAGTPRLVLQLREGARADVFASADEASMAALLEHSRTAQANGASTALPQIFAHNELALLVAAGNPLGITQLADLSRRELRFALAGPQVPAGRYARAALALAGVEAISRSDEASVRGVLNKVLLGELDAGVVYTTDLRHPDTSHELELVPIPAAYQPKIRYPIRALPQAEQPELAAAFVRFVLSDSGQSILRAHGFSAAR